MPMTATRASRPSSGVDSASAAWRQPSAREASSRPTAGSSATPSSSRTALRSSCRACPRRSPLSRGGHYARGMARLRVAAAQINVTVGDLAGNVERIVAAIEAAEAAGADLVAVPELAVSGYPPEDLLLRPAFVAEAQKALEKVAARTGQAVA